MLLTSSMPTCIQVLVMAAFLATVPEVAFCVPVCAAIWRQTNLIHVSRPITGLQRQLSLQDLRKGLYCAQHWTPHLHQVYAYG